MYAMIEQIMQRQALALERNMFTVPRQMSEQVIYIWFEYEWQTGSETVMLSGSHSRMPQTTL
jgi:hypothetical protein